MKTLIDFQLPNDGELALCEINGHVHSMNCDYANVNKFTNTVCSVSYFVSHSIGKDLILGRNFTTNILYKRFITYNNFRR